MLTLFFSNVKDRFRLFGCGFVPRLASQSNPTVKEVTNVILDIIVLLSFLLAIGYLLTRLYPELFDNEATTLFAIFFTLIVVYYRNRPKKN